MSLETRRYDAIVVMPYSSNFKSDRTGFRLSYWSAQSIHAGLHLWEQNLSEKIIIPGESAFGQKIVSTTDLMKRYLISKGVPHESIIERSNLNNTVLQLEEIKRLQKRHGLNRLLFVSCNWHIERVKQTIAAMKIEGDVVEVESVLSNNHSRTNRDVLLSIPATQRISRKDSVIRTNFLTKRLAFQKILGLLFGARIVDLHDDTYAIFKRRAAQRIARNFDPEPKKF